MTLAAFQREFASQLLSTNGGDARAAMAVYRNTALKACIDALEANFPAVGRLVGREWFRSAAAVHAMASPPRDPRLFEYGEDFAAFLRGFEPAAALPYLAAVAELDRLWIESAGAANATVMPANALAQLSPEQLGACQLRPHPATRWYWHDEWPVYSIWSRNRCHAQEIHDELPWQGEGALLSRPTDTVRWCPLTAGGAALLSSCAQRRSLGEAAQAALIAEPLCDLASTLALLLMQGAFAAQ